MVFVDCHDLTAYGDIYKYISLSSNDPILIA